MGVYFWNKKRNRTWFTHETVQLVLKFMMQTFQLLLTPPKQNRTISIMCAYLEFSRSIVLRIIT